MTDDENQTRVTPGQESLSMLVGEVLEHLHRLRRPLIVGFAVVMLVSVVVLLSPISSRPVGSAIIAVPTHFSPTDKGGMPAKPREADKGDDNFGALGFGDFRVMVRALQDPNTLAGHFPNHRNRNELAFRIPSLVSPVLYGETPAGVPIPMDARVVAVELSVSETSEAEATTVVNQLGAAVRSVLPNLLEGAWLQRLRLESALKRDALILGVQAAEREQEGFERLARALSRIPSASGAGGTREIVDASDKGHRYLPLPVQVNGARAAMAEAENELDLARTELAEIQAMDSFIARVNARVAEDAKQGKARVDLAAIVAEELSSLEASTGAPGARTQILDRMRSALEFFQARRTGIDFIQRPTVRFQRNYALSVAVGVLGGLTWLVLVLLGDSWKRHGRPAREAIERSS